MSSNKQNPQQTSKIFIGGLSGETTSEKLRAFFENFGVVREAFISVNKTNGRPRGFGFVTFESAEVAKKVIATKLTIDRREVEAKEAVAKEEHSSTSQASSDGSSVRNRKLFVGGLAPAVDNAILKQHFEAFGAVETAEVMLDHDSGRPRGFGFVTFVSEEMERVFEQGAMHIILEKQVEIKSATPRNAPSQVMQMAQGPYNQGGRGMGPMPRNGGGFFPAQQWTQLGGVPAAGYGPRSSLLQGPHVLPPRVPGAFHSRPSASPGFQQQQQEQQQRRGYDNSFNYQLALAALAAQQQLPGTNMRALQSSLVPYDMSALQSSLVPYDMSALQSSLGKPQAWGLETTGGIDFSLAPGWSS